jgi:hypothetical protein
MKIIFQGLMLFFILSICMISTFCHAAPFNIVPKPGISLPTKVAKGHTVRALYTVTNTTTQFQSGNYVKPLPPNVTQITVDGTFRDLCGVTFSLGANESCTLELHISGLVNGNDPNPLHQLLICLGNCSACCSGTYFPLHITEKKLKSIDITPIQSTINIGTSQQYSAVGTYSDQLTDDITSLVTWHFSNPGIATISSSGLATGISSGSTTITAELNSINSNSSNLIVAANDLSLDINLNPKDLTYFDNQNYSIGIDYSIFLQGYLQVIALHYPVLITSLQAAYDLRKYPFFLSL